MLQVEWLMLIGAGGLFILLGLGAIMWSKGEKRGYYEVISHRLDVREYLEHGPERPEPRALKIGGWIAITIGIILGVVGGGFWLWG